MQDSEPSRAEREYNAQLQRPQEVREVCKWVEIAGEFYKICRLVPVKPVEPEEDSSPTRLSPPTSR